MPRPFTDIVTAVSGNLIKNGTIVVSTTRTGQGGKRYFPVGYRAVFTQDLYGNTDTGLVSGSTVLDVGSNAQLLALLNPNTGYGNVQFLLYNNITITYSDNTTQTFSDCRCTNINGSVLSFGYEATTAGHNFPITLQTANYNLVAVDNSKINTYVLNTPVIADIQSKYGNKFYNGILVELVGG